MSLPVAIGVTGSLLFLLPIYLASQTVPMLAELTNVDGHAGKASGKVLFFSTMGSVAGGIITPVWLFPTLGVARSTLIVCGSLAIAAAVMALGHFLMLKMAGVGAAGLIIVVSAYAFAPSPSAVYAFDSAYQSVRIVEEKGEDGRTERVLLMGGSRASGIYAGSGETSFAYVLAAEQALAEVGPETVLVIGAAGFTFPRDVANVASVKRIDAVDVDPVVKYIAEQKFLQRALPAKVRFLPLSARYAVRRLRKDGNRYGFTLVDAYFGKGIPDELVTVEFFRDIREVSGHTAVNVVMDRDMDSDFAKNLLASFREAFGGVWVKDVKPGDEYLTNVLVTDWAVAGSEKWGGNGVVYRDDKNSAGRDHVELMW
jgi:spermidine synthase